VFVCSPLGAAGGVANYWPISPMQRETDDEQQRQICSRGGLRVDNMLMHAVKKNFQTFEEHMLADQPITLSYTYRPRCWLAGGLRDDTERGRSSSTKDLSLTGRTKIFRSANTLRKSFQRKYLDWMELHELFSFQACCFLACEDRRSTFSSLD
jgi:hypothetical protein